jgi:hypothetical protein
MPIAIAFGSVLLLLGLLLLPPRPRGRFLAALVALAVFAVSRSQAATRLDGFTIDEPYHIVAGVSYVRTGDFRLNPEHPPLAKLWVGAALPAESFELPAFRPLNDKIDERRFVNTAVFLDNDPDLVQRRARWALFVLNSLLLATFGLAARRALGEGVALGAVAFLAIDPTVAAHLPVVMTDLPVALTSGTAVLLAAVAFRSWRAPDLAAASLALGAALAAKHSGLVTLAVAGALGAALVLVPSAVSRARRLALAAAVLLGAVAVLSGTYGFRYDESPERLDPFNRPLTRKIEDLNTPVYREGMELLVRSHLLPRAYLWGLADILRAGMEGRGDGMLAFGRWYPLDAPWYFFPGVILLKLPLGLALLALAGAALAFRGGAGDRLPLLAALALAAVYLVVLGSGEAYAGVRHALPVFPALALLGGIALAAAVRGGRAVRTVAAAGLIAAAASALPVLRPWEYYNELIGTEDAYLYFADEGIDLGQRTREAVRYYNRELRPRGVVPVLAYPVSRQERQRYRIRSVDLEDPRPSAGNRLSGTVIVAASALAPFPRLDLADLRRARPVARFGNLLVFRGTFHIPWRRAMACYAAGVKKLLLEKDPRGAESLFAEAARLYPPLYPAAVELGNLRARRGARRQAIQAYELARAQATPGDPLIERLTEQIERLRREPPRSLPPVRNPWAE